ncbi:hypothetical protein AAFF_G00257210 [Aldrovandia affinis]|uniref:Harmonin-binding protein USHBP1 PDZ-binding domain-containing protein n=1 Tax=Aldrovandia affinis TaxID=143900 RepID=A0AAD7SUA3_9TELE|nr:hypothetical protein AAFF_G00257210 [Aldrovandia affinis]
MDSTECHGDQGTVLTEGAGLEDCEETTLASSESPQKGREEPPVPTGPTELELAQCEAEVGSLLRIIADLNGRMNALQAPRDSADSAVVGQEMSSIPDPVSQPSPSHRVPEESDAPTASESSGAEKEDSGQIWMELQGALTALESSVITGRTRAAPHTACDEEIHAQHLAAARESWVKVTQVLEELERDVGVSYPSELPAEEKRKYQRDVLALHERNCNLRATLQCREKELCRSTVTLSGLKEERNKLQLKLLGLQKHRQAGGSLSPPNSPSSSSSGAMSPRWASPPFPGSPLLLRRPIGAFPALATGGDSALPSSASPSTTLYSSPGSSLSGGLETETDRLQRCIERLKARNERLSAALERRKGESEQISMTLSKHEANSTALQMALRYSEECEEAYNELLCLYDARRQQELIPEPRETTESGKETLRLSHSKPETRSPETGESLLSLSPPGGAKEAVQHQHNRGTPSVLEGQEQAIREKIWKLKQDRAAVCVPAREPDGDSKPSPDTGTLSGPRGQDTTRPHNTKREKATLLYELVTVREEMSELRGTIRLTEKERRCLEWTLTAQQAQDVAGALMAESLREELEDRQTERQKLAETGAKPDSGGGIPGPRNRTILRELQAALQREQILKRRLVLAHSKAAGTYRSACRKHREQLWRLERQVTAISERHMMQVTSLKATLEALQLKREETVLTPESLSLEWTPSPKPYLVLRPAAGPSRRGVTGKGQVSDPRGHWVSLAVV